MHFVDLTVLKIIFNASLIARTICSAVGIVLGRKPLADKGSTENSSTDHHQLLDQQYWSHRKEMIVLVVQIALMVVRVQMTVQTNIA